jgi:transposase InsO family protein
VRPLGKIVVPAALIPDVLVMFHGVPITGHYGRDKTIHHISTYFWWKSLTKDVVDRVKGCHVCQMRKQTRPKRHMPPGGFVATAPMEMVVIDTVVSLPPSNGNVRLLTVVDVFSKFSLAIPVPNERSETVGRALNEHLFSVHGYPKLLMSDRAKGFVSRGLKWLCKHLGIAKILSTGLLPTACSPVERYHRSLGATLTMVCNNAKNDWSFLVSAVVFSYNISVCETTGFSPFFLMYGRQPNLPIDVLTGLRANTLRHKDHSYVETMTQSLKDAYKIVRQRQLRTLERNKRVQLGLKSSASNEQVAEALMRRQVPEFAEGDLVSFWEPEAADTDLDHVMPKKLQYRWSGPHQILERDGDHYYINRRGERLQVNPGRLRTYHKWSDEPVGRQLEQDPEAVTQIAQGEPTVGQMVVIPLELRLDMSRPFAVAKIKAVREDGSYLVDWWGNRDSRMEGTYRPGWVNSQQARHSRSYAAENPGQLAPCTSDTTGQIVFREHLKYWGFRLQYDDRLPDELKQLLHGDISINWTWEGQ